MERIAKEAANPTPKKVEPATATTAAAPRKRNTIIRERIRQSYVIQGKDPEKVTQEQIEEDVGNAFHSMWSNLGNIAAKGGKEMLKGAGGKALETMEKVSSKVQGTMEENTVYPSEVLERVTGGFAKKKYVTGEEACRASE